MPMCDIKDHKTGQTLKAYDFGGPEVYYAGTSLVYAPLGGTSVSSSENLATLNPLGITSIMKPRWEVTGHVGIGTAGWRVSVVDTSTGNTKDGVYPFNWHGNLYELECQPGTWVIASCGGYKIESSWVGQASKEAFRLLGTVEIIKIIAPNFDISKNYSSGSLGINLTNTSPYYLQNERQDTAQLVVNNITSRQDCAELSNSSLSLLTINVVGFGSTSAWEIAWDPCSQTSVAFPSASPSFYQVVEYPTAWIDHLIYLQRYAKRKFSFGLEFTLPITPIITFTPATWHIGGAWWDTGSSDAYYYVEASKRVNLYNPNDFPFADRAFIESLPGVLD